MKINDKHLSYGVLNFIHQKQLDRKEIADWLLINYSAEVKIKNDTIYNADEIISKNWDEFHSWVNEGLLKGTIKGKKISLSNGSSEREDKYKKACKEFIEQAEEGAYELYCFYRKKAKHKQIGQLMQNFFKLHDSKRKHKAGDCPIEIDFGYGKDMKFHRYYMDFLQVVEEGLSERFKVYIKDNLKNK